MSEGQQFEIPPKSHDPQSVETILEKGEIIGRSRLEGHSVIDVVEIKDDGKGLFRPEGGEPFLGRFRIQLELLAKVIDNALNLELIPEVVRRSIQGQDGTLQRYITDAKPHICYYGSGPDWMEIISEEDLAKAALFDYLIKAGDRKRSNFLIDKNKKRIWLIDHDDLMFSEIEGCNYGSDLLYEANRRGLTRVDDEMKSRLEILSNKLTQILKEPLELGTKELPIELKTLLGNIKERAIATFKTGLITA